MSSFTPNGATSGAAGLIGSAPSNPYSGNVALPVSLKKFSAKINRDAVEIAWTTAAEINCDYFTVSLRIRS